MSLFKSALTVSFFTLLSRIFGMIRDVLIASALGTTALADAFFVALRFPNLFRQFSAEGAFTAAFVPLYASKLDQSDEKARHFAQNIQSLMLIILILFTIMVLIFMPQIMTVLAPGFTKDPEKFAHSVNLSRIVFPYLIFISLVALYGGILNSANKFAIAAAAPIFLNLIMIAPLLIFHHNTQDAAYFLSYSVIIAGIAQLLWMIIFSYKYKVFIKLTKPKIDKDSKLLFKRMIPGIIGSSITQINLLINTTIATLIPGAISYLSYADRLSQLPLALIGTSLGIALLPALSRFIKNKDEYEANKIQNSAFNLAMFFTLPAAFALIALSYPLINLLFQRGSFHIGDTIATSQALCAFAIGLPAFVLIKIFAPGFHARGNTKTPVKIGLICVFVNFIIAVGFIQYIGYISLAIATSASSWLNAILLGIVLWRNNHLKLSKDTITKSLKSFCAALLMGFILYITYQNISNIFLSTILIKKVIIMGFLCFFGLGAYLGLCYLSGNLDIKLLRNIVKKQK